METVQIPSKFLVLKIDGIDDVREIAEKLKVDQNTLIYIKTMHKVEQEPELLNGIFVTKALADKVLELQDKYQLIKIDIPYQIVKEYQIDYDVELAYKEIMHELSEKKQAMASFPIEWYDYGSRTMKLVIGTLHD